MIRSKNAGPFWPAMNILATKNQLKLSSKCWCELVHRNYGFKLHKSSSAEGMHKLNCCVAKRLFSTNHFRSLVHCWGDNNRGFFLQELQSVTGILIGGLHRGISTTTAFWKLTYLNSALLSHSEAVWAISCSTTLNQNGMWQLWCPKTNSSNEDIASHAPAIK